jgi:hypothetical protein
LILVSSVQRARATRRLLGPHVGGSGEIRTRKKSVQAIYDPISSHPRVSSLSSVLRTDGYASHAYPTALFNSEFHGVEAAKPT